MTKESDRFETPDRGPELLNRIRVILETAAFTETDVAWACAVLGGQAIAMASEDNLAFFAENVETFVKEFTASAGERFAEHGSEIKRGGRDGTRDSGRAATSSSDPTTPAPRDSQEGQPRL